VEGEAVSADVLGGLRVAVALAALVVAGVVAVAAEDARRWDDRLRTDDLRFVAQPSGGARWRESKWLGAAAVRSTLGIDDDLRFRRVVSAFRVERADAGSSGDAIAKLQLRAQLEGALRAIQRNDPDPLRRARAANMIGILSFESAVTGRSGEQSLLDQTLAQFRNAVRIDPREEEPKYNLELLLHLLARGDLRSTGGRGGEGGPESEAGGAGTTDPGRGY
jgi:hypothetical protein